MSLGAKPRHLECGLRGGFRHRFGQHRAQGHIVRGLPLTEAEDLHRRLDAELARPLLAHHHHGGGAVRDEADIVAPQRLDDERRLHVFVERERHAQRCMRVVGAVVAHRDRDLAELLRFRAVFRHVTLHRHARNRPRSQNQP